VGDIKPISQQRKRALVSAPVAAVLSIIPGLGQMFAREFYRGLLFFASFATAIALFVWRLHDIARRDELLIDRFTKSLTLETSFVLFVLLFMLLLWALNIWDAYILARDGRKGRTGVFLALIATYFVLGWQISDIDMVRLVREAPQALPPLSRVVWPWEAAITYDTDTVQASARILIGDEYEPPEQPEPEPGEPVLESNRYSGDLSEQDRLQRFLADIDPGSE
jgi:uncharacterized membrane protein YhaH (DUF805 family)